MSVKKKGNKWIVTDKSGKKILGTHDTKKEADRQLRAVEASKSRENKKRKRKR